MLYRLLRRVMRLLVAIVLGDQMHVEGTENIPGSGPLLIVGNHVATIDPPLLGACVRRTDVHFMAKSEHFSRSATRWLFYGYHAFPVVRGTADRPALRHALRLLDDGAAVVVYPEGRRSWDGRLRRPHAGAGFLARRAGVPVLPVAVWGTEKVLTRGSHWPHRAAVHVRFGAPFVIPARDERGVRIGNQHAADLMMQRVAELLPPRYRGIFDGGTDIEAVPPPAA
jgi:1-acyl-sn-glycerol-3-phosphate acyltransferase